MRNLSLTAKKGQVSSLAPAILALVFAGIVLVFGIIMSEELRNTQDGAELITVTSNQTLTITGTGTSSEITESDYCGYTSWNATILINCTAPTCAGATNETLVEGTDYVVNANGSISNLTYVESGLKASGYTYYYGGEACSTANLTVVGLGSFADFWEIIVLAIVITIVIGLLLVIFGGKTRR